MSYPVPQGGFPPGQPYGGPIPPRPRNGGGTAITAALLSVCGAPFHAYLVLAPAFQLFRSLMYVHDARQTAFSIVACFVEVVTAGLLLVGAVRLFQRRRSGRTMIATACGLVLGFGAVAIVGIFVDAWWYEPGFVIMAYTLLPVPFAVATLVLALVPTTKRWCRPQQATARY